MREFKIYAESKEGSKNWSEFLKDLEKRINADQEIIERAKQINEQYTEEVKKILEDAENSLYASTMIEGIKKELPRFTYIKNLEYNGTKYDCEIDLLFRKFRVDEQ